MKTLIIIPARYGSTRFPAKPLQYIKGKTLLQRVVRLAERVCENYSSHFLVATDHEKILDHCQEIGAPAVMTDPELASGTDRALSAVEKSNTSPDFVINLQGDAPFTPPSHVGALISKAEVSKADVITPVIQLNWDALDVLRKRKEKTPFSGTTCLRNDEGKAYWFSKQILPSIRNEHKLREIGPLSPVFRHIGLYGYKIDALKKFVKHPIGHYEKLEGLEQLRFLENDMNIDSVVVETPKISMSGVDTPEDAELAEELIELHGDPYDSND